jgi:imidazolonepropionase-like amidohydrolase
MESVASIIKASLLIDGRGEAPLADPAVVVRDGKIVGVFQGEVPAGVAGDGAKVFDYPGCTLLPGLIDCHVHLCNPGDGTPADVWMTESDGVLTAAAAFSAQSSLDAGITTLRDCGARGDTASSLRRSIELGHGHGPRLVLCGQPITITGGHGWGFGGEADGEDGLRLKVRQLAKNGADFIKVLGSGGGTANTMSWLPAFRAAEFAAIVDEAHRMARKITIHSLCAEASHMAMDAGVDQIEHGGFIVDAAGNQLFDPKVAERLAESGVVVTPTLAVGGYVLQNMHAKSQHPADEQAFVDRWERMMEANLDHVGKMHRAGVRMVAGTDAGWRFTPFDGLPEELRFMSEGGMPASEVIRSGTSYAAAALGIDSQVGSVVEGLEADVIAVEGNPLEDLRRLRNLRLVMQRGRVHRGAEAEVA